MEHGGFEKVLMREIGCTTRSAQLVRLIHEREQAKEPGILGGLHMMESMSKSIPPTDCTCARIDSRMTSTTRSVAPLEVSSEPGSVEYFIFAKLVGHRSIGAKP